MSKPEQTKGNQRRFWMTIRNTALDQDVKKEARARNVSPADALNDRIDQHEADKRAMQAEIDRLYALVEKLAKSAGAPAESTTDIQEGKW